MKWSEISFENFYKIKKILELETSNINKEIKIYSLLYKIDENILLDYGLDKYKIITTSLMFLFTPPELITTNYIILNKIKYVIPTKYDMTVGQYIDIENDTYIKDEYERDSSILSNFLIPENILYKDITLEDKRRSKELFKDIPIQIVLGFLNFIGALKKK